MDATAPICPVCAGSAELVTGRTIYPRRPDLAEKPIWRCTTCPDAYVGCYPGTTTALGTPAGPELRRERWELHARHIDPLWRSVGAGGRTMSKTDRRAEREDRSRVYAFLAVRLGLPLDRTHTAMFDLESCARARIVLEGATRATILDWSASKAASLGAAAQ